MTRVLTGALVLTAFAGVARLPEISLPVARVEGIPVGISFAAGHYQDEFLLDAAKTLWATIRNASPAGDEQTTPA